MRHPNISPHTESVLRRSVEAARRRSYRFDPYLCGLAVDTLEFSGDSQLLVDFREYWRLYSTDLGFDCFVLLVAPREFLKAARHTYIWEAAVESAQLTIEQAGALFSHSAWPVEFQIEMAASMYNGPHIEALKRRVEHFIANAI
jgi:hypothetical protein